MYIFIFYFSYTCSQLCRRENGFTSVVAFDFSQQPVTVSVHFNFCHQVIPVGPFRRSLLQKLHFAVGLFVGIWKKRNSSKNVLFFLIQGKRDLISIGGSLEGSKDELLFSVLLTPHSVSIGCSINTVSQNIICMETLQFHEKFINKGLWIQTM